MIRRPYLLASEADQPCTMLIDCSMIIPLILTLIIQANPRFASFIYGLAG